jgi:UDP-GlcNAc:undecaprenyl-phosphate GlcNAc-1-phosphate transferase
MTGEISVYVTPAAVAAALMLALLARYYPQWLGDALRTVLYLIIPTVIYFTDFHLTHEEGLLSIRLYNLSFAIMALLTILVSKLTRRSKGFKSTPMDFLILFIVVIIPTLPVSDLADYRVGMIAGKIIICYYALEVLMAELRKDFRRATMGTIVTLLILAAQGLR